MRLSPTLDRAPFRASAILAILVLLALPAAALDPLGPPAAWAQERPPEAYRLADTWASSPQRPRPPGEISGPAGLDVAPDGRVYVADETEGVIHVLGSDGSGIARVGGPGTGPGQLRGPRDVAEADGRLYVADAGNGRVQVFDAASGAFLAAWPGLGSPTGIAAEGDRVFASDPERARILLLDRAGQLLEQWGPDGQRPVALERPMGLDLRDGRLYVADAGALRVLVLDDEGALLDAFDRAGGNTDYDRPLDVAAAEDGEILIASPRRLYGYVPLGPLWIPRPGPYFYGGLGLAVGPGEGVVAAVRDARTAFHGVLRYPDRDAWNRDAPDAWGGLALPLGQLDGPRALAARADDVALLDGQPRVQLWRDGAPRSQARVARAADLTRDAAAGGAAVLRAAGEGEAGRWLLSPLGAGGAPVSGADVELGPLSAWARAADADGPRAAVLAAGEARAWLLRDGALRGSLDLGGVPVDLALGGDRLFVADRGAAEIQVYDLAGGGAGPALRIPAPGDLLRLAAAPGGGRLFALTTDGWVWAFDGAGALRAAFDGAPGGAAVDVEARDDGAVLVLDGQGDRLRLFLPDPTGEAPLPPAPGDRCALWPSKTADPASLDLGEETTITLALAGDCPRQPTDLDVLLAVDRSGSMEGGKIFAAQSAAVDFSAELDYARARVGLVSFSGDARVDLPLSAERAALVRAVAGLTAGGSTDIGSAIATARAELAVARPGAEPVIVLMTDGLPDDPGRARDEAAAARAAGITLFTIGLGEDLDPDLLRELAGAEERAFLAPGEAELGRIYTEIARRLATSLLLQEIEVEDELPADMAYVPGSAEPVADWDPARRVLTWRLAEVPAAGFALRYRVRPTVLGLRPANVVAVGRYRDGVGHQDELVFPVPRVQVNGPRAWRAFLPFAVQDRCPQRRIDVALLVDESSSMAAASGLGGSKLDEAKRAARDFLDVLRLPGDRAAVISFAGEAVLRQGLTGDGGALARAIASIEGSRGTRIDRGLGLALEELTGPRRAPGSLPVLILLTDGQPEGGSREETLSLGRRLREAGVVTYAIGLGPDAEGGFLIELAGDPERYLHAPGAADLGRLYRQIGLSLPCE